jgi:hypothetical protein
MICNACKAEVSAGNKFCGQCGKQVDCDVDPKLLKHIDDRIQEAISTKLKDQKVLEIDSAQQVTSRILGWAKLFAGVVALPLALLGATLTIWGVSSFLDFRQKVTAGKEQIKVDISETKSTITATKLEADNLRKDLESARASLGALPKDVQILQSKVSRIEERIGYVTSPALTPRLKKNLQSLLESFQIYCRNVGFPVKPGDVKVHIYTGNTPEPGKAAYYDSAKSEMSISASFADDPSVVLREYMHRQLDRSPAGATHFGKDYVAVEAGLSCYYPASFRNLSDCGGWDLNRLDSYAQHRSTAPALAVVWGVNVWGGLFWGFGK